MKEPLRTTSLLSPKRVRDKGSSSQIFISIISSKVIFLFWKVGTNLRDGLKIFVLFWKATNVKDRSFSWKTTTAKLT